MESEIIEKKIKTLEEKLLRIVEDGEETPKSFSYKADITLPRFYDWRAGRFIPSHKKILDMARRLGL